MSNRVRFSGGIRDIEVESDNQTNREDVSTETPEEIENRRFNKFELLGLADESDQEQDDNQDVDKSEISDEGGSSNEADSKNRNDSSKSSVAVQNNKKRNYRKKRGKKGSKKGDKESQDPFYELENLSRAIVLHSSANETRDQLAKFKLLKVDPRNLIPETELKRIFGKSVITEDKSNRRPHLSSNLQRSRFVSSHYIEIKSMSQSVPRMELDDALNNAKRGQISDSATKQSHSGPTSSLSGVEEPVYFRFIHHKNYQETQRMFIQNVNQGNPELILDYFVIAPYHAETLVQISHILRVTEDYKTAAEFLERALYVFEMGFHPKFNISTAMCRLSYKRPENRTFFITIFKHINYCHRRGLRRTPFEYSKLLLSLEPENDPLLAVQLLDFFAIRSEEYDYLIDFYSQWNHTQKLPNLTFSRALAHFLKSKNTKNSKAENEKQLSLADRHLQEALILFPNFIVPLLDACSAEPDTELKRCQYFDYSVYSTKYKEVPETVDVLVNLYVKRCYSLWKQKHVLHWLERNVATMVNKFNVGELVDEGRHREHWQRFSNVVPKNLLRHIVLCDLEIKMPSTASSSTFLDIDPYPPSDSLVSYDPNINVADANRNESSFLGGMSGLFLRSFLPSFSLTEHQNTSAPLGNQQQVTANRSIGQRARGTRATTSLTSSRNITENIPSEQEFDEVRDPSSNSRTNQDVGQFDELHSRIRDLTSAVSDLTGLVRSRMHFSSGGQDEQGQGLPQQSGDTSNSNDRQDEHEDRANVSHRRNS